MKKKSLYLLLGLTVALSACSEIAGEQSLIEEPIISSESRGFSGADVNLMDADASNADNYLSYEDNIVNRGYSSSIIYYPSVTSSKPLPVAIIMHGYMGQKEKLAYLGQRLAEKGFASFVITAINHDAVFTNPKDWIYNYDVAFESIIAENERKESPLYHKLDTNKINIIGHSMGAGGAIYFADQEGLQYNIKAIVAMAPYSLEIKKPGKNITAPTLIMAGKRDHLALPIMTKKFFDTLGSKEKAYFFDDHARHTDFESEISKYSHLTEQVLMWLDKYGK